MSGARLRIGCGADAEDPPPPQATRTNDIDNVQKLTGVFSNVRIIQIQFRIYLVLTCIDAPQRGDPVARTGTTCADACDKNRVWIGPV